MEQVFISTVSRSLNGLFAVISGLKPHVVAILLLEFWDCPPPQIQMGLW